MATTAELEQRVENLTTATNELTTLVLSVKTFADTAATEAGDARDAAQQLFEQLGTSYLGKFSAAPTEDRDGDPLESGDYYWNTSTAEFLFYSDLGWLGPATAAAEALLSREGAEAALALAEQARDVATQASESSIAAEQAAEQFSAQAGTHAQAAEDEAIASASSATAAATARDATESYREQTEDLRDETTSLKNQAQASQSAAKISETNSKNSELAAASSENSALGYKNQAQSSAAAASASESNAFSYKNLAQNAAAAAAGSESNSLTYKNQAQSAKDAAEAAQSASETAQVASEAAQSEAESSEIAAKASEDLSSLYAESAKMPFMSNAALSRRFIPVSGNVDVVAFEDDTRVFVNNSLVATLDAFETHQYAASVDDSVVCDRPFACQMNAGASAPALCQVGSYFGHYVNRHLTQRLSFFSPWGPANVEVFVRNETTATGPDSIGDAPTSTVTVQRGTWGVFEISTSGGDFSENDRITFRIKSDAPILVYASSSGADNVCVLPASKVALSPASYNAIRTMRGLGSVTHHQASSGRAGAVVAPEGDLIFITRIADGAGTDAECHAPVESLGTVYAMPHDVRGYRVVAVEDCTISLFDSNGNVLNTHDLSGASLETPMDAMVGSESGSGSALYTGPVMAVGTRPFYLRTNDAGDNEYVALGFRGEMRHALNEGIQAGAYDAQRDAIEQAASASGSEAAALSYKNEAKSYRDSALTHKNDADAAKSASESARDTSVSAKNQSVAARDQAQAAQLAAEQLLDQFGDRYLGSHPSDPVTDNDGDPLLDGASYWNTTTQELRFYTGSGWVAPEDVATTAAADAQAAAAASEASRQASVTAKNSSVTAKNSSEQARDESQAAAASASSSEANALTYKNQAQSAKTAAELAQSETESARDDVQGLKASVESSEANALTYKNQAQSAKTASEAAKVAAESAATEAEQNKNDSIANTVSDARLEGNDIVFDLAGGGEARIENGKLAIVGAQGMPGEGAGGGVFTIWGERNGAISGGQAFAFGNGASATTTGVRLPTACKLYSMGFSSSGTATMSGSVALVVNNTVMPHEVEIVDGQGFVTFADGLALNQGDVVGFRCVTVENASGVSVVSASFVTEGVIGEEPAHEWSGTSLRFQKPDGTWGDYVDLIGPVGPPAGVDSVNGRQGAVTLSASDVGLGNVDNTSDLNKPISTAQQAALDGKVSDTNGEVTGSLTITGENATDAILNLVADVGNEAGGEGRNPRVHFEQDGGALQVDFGYDYDTLGDNRFGLRSYFSGSWTTVFALGTDSVVNFSKTPTVLGNETFHEGHLPTVSEVSGLQAALDAKVDPSFELESWNWKTIANSTSAAPGWAKFLTIDISNDVNVDAPFSLEISGRFGAVEVEGHLKNNGTAGNPTLSGFICKALGNSIDLSDRVLVAQADSVFSFYFSVGSWETVQARILLATPRQSIFDARAVWSANVYETPAGGVNPVTVGGAPDGNVYEQGEKLDVRYLKLSDVVTYSVGDGGLTEKNFTSGLLTKLNGIEDGANNYVHPSTHTIAEVSGLQSELNSLSSAISSVTFSWGEITGKPSTFAPSAHSHSEYLSTSGKAADSDKLDGVQASQFMRSDANDSKTSGSTIFNDNTNLYFGSGSDARFWCNGWHMYTDLNSGIGNWYIRDGSTTRFTFDDAGHFTATGNVTAYSDERLKEGWAELPENFVEQLASAKSGTYSRKDNPGLGRQVGVGAQSLQKILPEAIVIDPEDPNEILSVSYGNAALAACVELAKEVVVLKERINKLESQNA